MSGGQDPRLGHSEIAWRRLVLPARDLAFGQEPDVVEARRHSLRALEEAPRKDK